MKPTLAIYGDSWAKSKFRGINVPYTDPEDPDDCWSSSRLECRSSVWEYDGRIGIYIPII